MPDKYKKLADEIIQMRTFIYNGSKNENIFINSKLLTTNVRNFENYITMISEKFPIFFRSLIKENFYNILTDYYNLIYHFNIATITSFFLCWEDKKGSKYKQKY